jgi:predicted nucleic acid-binding protein
MKTENRVFIDTNILVYAVSSGPKDELKINKARSLLLKEDWCWSTQVGFEFLAVTLRNRGEPILSFADAKKYLQVWMAYPMIGMTPKGFVQSLKIKEESQVSIWDAAIISCAQLSAPV